MKYQITLPNDLLEVEIYERDDLNELLIKESELAFTAAGTGKMLVEVKVVLNKEVTDWLDKNITEDWVYKPNRRRESKFNNVIEFSREEDMIYFGLRWINGIQN